MRHPVVLTSLEEDFRKLGLLSEEGMPSPPQKPAPAGEPAPNKNGSRNVGAQTDGDDDQGEDGNDTVPGHEGAVPKKAALPQTPGAQAEAIAGMPDPIRGGGSAGKAKPAHEADEGDDEEDKDKEDDDDKEKEESFELSGAESVLETVSRIRSGKPVAESKGPLATVERLLEDVNEIMDSIDDSRRNETIKAFANVSIISEMLRRGLANFAEAYEDADLAATSKALGALAEDSANIAQAIEEGEEIDREALEAEFRKEMEALMNGLDFYADVVEADSELAEADEDEKEKEDGDDDKDDEKGDEKDDEKEDEKSEAVKIRSPLIKGTRGSTRPGTGAGAGIVRAGGIVSSKGESYYPMGKGKKGMKG